MGGPDTGSPCVFPFTFQDKQYTACTLDAAGDGLPWCSTRTDDFGQHVKGWWGICSTDCQLDLVQSPPAETEEEQAVTEQTVTEQTQSELCNCGLRGDSKIVNGQLAKVRFKTYFVNTSELFCRLDLGRGLLFTVGASPMGLGRAGAREPW